MVKMALQNKLLLNPNFNHKNEEDKPMEKNLFEGAIDTFSGKHQKKKESSILVRLKQKLLKKNGISKN